MCGIQYTRGPRRCGDIGPEPIRAAKPDRAGHTKESGGPFRLQPLDILLRQARGLDYGVSGHAEAFHVEGHFSLPFSIPLACISQDAPALEIGG